MSFEEIWNWSFLERMMRPEGAPPYVPPELHRSLDQPLYYVADVLDHLIALPMNGTWIVAYTAALAIRWLGVQLDYYSGVLDANTTPHIWAFTKSLGFSVPTTDFPLWYKPGVYTRDYHNYCSDSTYRPYPTYELIRIMNERWHITFDPGKLGALGLNTVEPRSFRPPVICIGTDFAFGELKGSIHFGIKMNGNGFFIDSISRSHIKFQNSTTAPQVGIWLNFDLYEYNSAPAPRGPINVQELINLR